MTNHIFIAAIFSFTLQAVFASSSSAQTLDGSEQNLPDNIIGEVRIALTNVGARDPLSAQFHSLALNTEGDDATHICGYVNLKNGYGAYVGFQAFQMDLDDRSMNLLETTPDQLSWNLARMVYDMTGCSVVLDLPPRN